MPKLDKTGPMGAGTMTGRGLGLCTGAKAVKYGAGLGLGLACRRRFGRGFGRGYSFYEASPEVTKEQLEKQRVLLKNRLDAIDERLEEL
jgi:hypothetical protein